MRQLSLSPLCPVWGVPSPLLTSSLLSLDFTAKAVTLSPLFRRTSWGSRGDRDPTSRGLKDASWSFWQPPTPGFGLSTGHTHTIAAKNILPVSKVCSNCTEKPHLDAEVGLRNADSPSVSPRGHTLASGPPLTLRESPPSSLTPCPFQNWVSLWRSPQASCISLITTPPPPPYTHTLCCHFRLKCLSLLNSGKVKDTPILCPLSLAHRRCMEQTRSYYYYY